MPAVPIIGAVAAVAGAGAAVASTVNQAHAQSSAEKNAKQAQEQADAQAATIAQNQSGTGTQSTMNTSNVDNPSPLSIAAQQDLAHSIQALANATAEVNVQNQTQQRGIDPQQLLLWGGVALVLILILTMRKR